MSDSIKLRNFVSDIWFVANKEFMEQNSAARKFYEVFTLPLADINEQNTLMNEGKKYFQRCTVCSLKAKCRNARKS